MKVLKAVKFGSLRIFSHKLLAVISLLIFFTIFSIFFKISSDTQDAERELLRSGLDSTGEKVLVSVKLCKTDYLSEIEKCDEPTAYDNKAAELAKKYNAETVGANILYTSLISKKEDVNVILDKAMSSLIAEPPYYSGDKVPVILSKENSEKIPEGFYVLGNYPAKGPEKYLILDNAENVTNYLILNQYQVKNYDPVIRFENLNDAYRFYKENSDEFEITEMFADVLEVRKTYLGKFTKLLLAFIGIMVLTITYLIFIGILETSRDEKLVFLYRSQGATRKDVFQIYFAFELEILVISVLLALIFGALIL